MRWAISKVNSDEPHHCQKAAEREPAEPEQEVAPRKTLPKRMKRADHPLKNLRHRRLRNRKRQKKRKNRKIKPEAKL
jgi:hypothetical protein